MRFDTALALRQCNKYLGNPMAYIVSHHVTHDHGGGKDTYRGKHQIEILISLCRRGGKMLECMHQFFEHKRSYRRSQSHDKSKY